MLCGLSGFLKGIAQGIYEHPIFSFFLWFDCLIYVYLGMGIGTGSLDS